MTLNYGWYDVEEC